MSCEFDLYLLSEVQTAEAFIQLFGGIMRSSHNDKESGTVRMELKYCEHCGGLWVREPGAGVVYCDKCQPKVADLPMPKKRSSRTMLPMSRHSAVDDYQFDVPDECVPDLEAAGGVA